MAVVVSVVFQEDDLWVDDDAGAEWAAAALCWTASMHCSPSSSSLDCESCWVTIGIILCRGVEVLTLLLEHGIGERIEGVNREL